MLLWLWLWHRPAAIALIGPLAWELLYATGAALKSKKKKKKIYNVKIKIFNTMTVECHFTLKKTQIYAKNDKEITAVLK